MKQHGKAERALYTASKYGVDIIATGGTGSKYKDFEVILRKGRATQKVRIEWDVDGSAYVSAWGEKMQLKEFKANF